MKKKTRRRRKKEEEEAEEERKKKKKQKKKKKRRWRNCSPVVHVHGWLLSRVEAGRESSIDLSEAFLTADCDCREIAWLSV